MTDDSFLGTIDEEIAFYESQGLKVGLVVPCPICGIVMITLSGNSRKYFRKKYRLAKHAKPTLMCPECGITA